MWPLDSCSKTGSSCPSRSLISTAMTLTQSRNHCSDCYDFDCYGTSYYTFASNDVSFITFILVTFTISGCNHHFNLRCLNLHVYVFTHVMLLSSYQQHNVACPHNAATTTVDTCWYPEINHFHHQHLTGWETLVETAASGTRSPTPSPSDGSAADSDPKSRHLDTQSGIRLPRTIEQSCLCFHGQPIYVHGPNPRLCGQLQYY